MPSMTPNISSRISLSALGSPATFSANGSTAGSRRSPSARAASSASSLLGPSALSSRNLSAKGPPRRPIACHIDPGAACPLAFLRRARDERGRAPLARRLVADLAQQVGRGRIGGSGSPSTSASIAPLSGPMAVSTFSIE